jgi:hypothetical protein
MPIVFPVSVVEKVVEKIVEKIQYIAISLCADISMTHAYIENVAVPAVNTIVGQTLLSLSRFYYTFRLPLTKLSFGFISNPTRPIVSLILGVTNPFIQARGIMAQKPSLSYARVTNPPKPSPSIWVSFNPSVEVRKTP